MAQKNSIAFPENEASDDALLLQLQSRVTGSLKKILRKHEIGQLCGACYFSLGCTVSLTCFPPSVAMTSIVWLVLGDLSAALIGRSFGGDIVAVKLGREGKKSLEVLGTNGPLYWEI